MVTALKTDPEGFYRMNKLEGTPPRQDTSMAGSAAEQRKGV
jgi:hypothetical protein